LLEQGETFAISNRPASRLQVGHGFSVDSQQTAIYSSVVRLVEICEPSAGADKTCKTFTLYGGKGVMREQLRKLDAEYGFKLTDAEIDRIANEAKETEWLFQQINEVDVSGKTPLMKLPLKRAER
jgi:hypothetical protein